MPEPPDKTILFEGLNITPKLLELKSPFEGVEIMAGLPDTKSFFEGLDVTPALPDTKGLFEVMNITPELPELKSPFEGVEVTAGLPDTKSFFEGLNITAGLPDTKGLFEVIKIAPELPELKSPFEGVEVTAGLPDTKSFFEGLNIPAGLPDTKSFFGDVQVASELLHTKGLFEDLNVTPGLPDTKSLLEGLRVMPEWLGTNKLFEVVDVTPGVIEFRASPLDISTIRDSFIDGGDAGISRADIKSAPSSDTIFSCDQLLFRAQFDLRFDLAPVPHPIDLGEAYSTPDHLCWVVFRELERKLRSVVREHLFRLAGTNWVKQRVPPDVEKQWQERQEEDRAAGRPVYQEIQYADFMDLYKIIARRDNWRDVFQAIFINREDIGVSFSRLHPVRKALGHSRPLRVCPRSLCV